MPEASAIPLLPTIRRGTMADPVTIAEAVLEGGGGGGAGNAGGTAGGGGLTNKGAGITDGITGTATTTPKAVEEPVGARTVLAAARPAARPD